MKTSKYSHSSISRVHIPIQKLLPNCLKLNPEVPSPALCIFFELGDEPLLGTSCIIFPNLYSDCILDPKFVPWWCTKLFLVRFCTQCFHISMSGARETDSQRQVRQMVNFIMQEANEKVNELRIKVCMELNLVCDFCHFFHFRLTMISIWRSSNLFTMEN